MAYKLNLVIDQGSDYSNTIVLNSNNDPSANLPGNTTFVAQFRDSYTDPDSVFSFNVSTSNTTVNNQIYLAVKLVLTANQTANLNTETYVWDLVENANGNLTRIREGYIFVDEGITDIIPANTGTNTSNFYNFLTFTYDSAVYLNPKQNFQINELIYQSANSTANGVSYTYNTAVGVIQSVTSNTSQVESVSGTFQTNEIFTGASSNAVANLVSIVFS